MQNKRKRSIDPGQGQRERQAAEDEGEEEKESLVQNAALVLLPNTETRKMCKMWKLCKKAISGSFTSGGFGWHVCRRVFMHVVPKRNQVSWSRFTQHLHTNAIRPTNAVRPKVINLIKALRFSAFIALCFEYKEE